MSEEYRTAEDEAFERGHEMIRQWDETLAEIERKWGLPEGESLDDYMLEFRRL